MPKSCDAKHQPFSKVYAFGTGRVLASSWGTHIHWSALSGPCWQYVLYFQFVITWEENKWGKSRTYMKKGNGTPSEKCKSARNTLYREPRSPSFPSLTMASAVPTCLWCKVYYLRAWLSTCRGKSWKRHQNAMSFLKHICDVLSNKVSL